MGTDKIQSSYKIVQPDKIECYFNTQNNISLLKREKKKKKMNKKKIKNRIDTTLDYLKFKVQRHAMSLHHIIDLNLKELSRY